MSSLIQSDALENIDEVDLVFDVLGGDVVKRPVGLIRKEGKLVSIKCDNLVKFILS